MKKKFTILLALALAVCSLTACGDEAKTTESGSISTTELAEPTIEPTVELVKTENDATDLSLLPVEEYVTVGDYKAIEVTVAPIKELTDEELAEYLQTYFYSDAAAIPADKFAKEGTVQNGDVILLDYSGKLNGEVFEGGTATSQTLGIGAGQFIDGFEEGLVGVKAGETVDLNLTFPENYGNELAGQDVVFTVTVHGIATMNDATIAAMGREGYETVESYKEAIELFAAYEQQSNYYSSLSNAITEQLLEISEAHKLPEQLYEQEKQLLIEQMQMYAMMYGLDGDTYAQYLYGMNLNDYAVYATEAYLVRGVILQVIANKEGIAPTDEEVEAYVKDYVAMYGEAYGIESEESFYETTSKEDVKVVLLQEKVINYLADTITIKDAE